MGRKPSQTGQSLVEYALAASLCVAALGGLLLALRAGLDRYGSHLCLLLSFPNP